MNFKLIKIFILGTLLIINIFLFLNIYDLKKQNEFEIDFLDVGQGNSTLIKYKDLFFLIDSGNELYARENFYKNISFFKRDLDFVFATHYDLDHVGNLVDYFEKYNVGYFFKNGKESKAPIYDELLKIIKKKKIKNFNLVAGDILKINDDFYIRILFPENGINKNKLRDNASSLVLQIFYKNKKFLITGDSPQKIEKWLVKKYGKSLKSDILLAGHHGSKTSSSEEFLKAVDPDLVIFSVSKNNSYHHPHPSVLGLLKKLGIKSLRTDEVGSIKFIFDGESWKRIIEK